MAGISGIHHDRSLLETTVNTPSSPIVERGTATELLQATACGARLAARKLRDEGLNENAVRLQVIHRFCAEFGDDEPGELMVETLVAVVQRSVEEILGNPAPMPLFV